MSKSLHATDAHGNCIHEPIFRLTISADRKCEFWHCLDCHKRYHLTFDTARTQTGMFGRDKSRDDTARREIARINNSTRTTSPRVR